MRLSKQDLIDQAVNCGIALLILAVIILAAVRAS